MDLSSTPANLTLRIAWTTVASADEASRLAQAVIATRLAACVQIDGPIRSVYAWEGKIACTEEFRLWLKYPASNEEAVHELVHRLHPYTVPQWIAVEARSVGAAYLHWVRESTTAPDPASDR